MILKDFSRYQTFWTKGTRLFNARKNSIRLLQAFIEVLNDYPQAQLVIAGGETLFDYQAYRDKLFALVNSAGIKIGQSLILLRIRSADALLLCRCVCLFLPQRRMGTGDTRSDRSWSSGDYGKSTALYRVFKSDSSPADRSFSCRFGSGDARVAHSLVEQSRLIIAQYSWERSAQLHLDYYQQLLMPEIHFQIKWPDGSQQTCYSPSLIVKDYFTPGQAYELEDFLERSRTALNTASDRVQAKYGMPCRRALSQLQQIEAKANQYRHSDQIHFLQFKEGSA